ncbi:hypothetical protein [Algoriphagus resistens]|uniref:hypothetical protein n=1 Tax=Algoriphagus resistens TaxID=1750590 RepID=UPI000B031D7F|nr:hypothetical protein [Algoriphagus resistens]
MKERQTQQRRKSFGGRPAFKKLKNKHNAGKSNINELEHRGLDRCPDRNRKNFDRYIGLAVTAYKPA